MTFSNKSDIISGKVELTDLVLKPSALVSRIKTSTQYNLVFLHWFLVYWMSNSNLLLYSPQSASISIDYLTVPVHFWIRCNTRYVVYLSLPLHQSILSIDYTCTCMLDNILGSVNSFLNEEIICDSDLLPKGMKCNQGVIHYNDY